MIHEALTLERLKIQPSDLPIWKSDSQAITTKRHIPVTTPRSNSGSRALGNRHLYAGNGD